MTRAGLNFTMSYHDGSKTRAYRVRCKGLSHGYTMVSNESQARATRAFYPHRTAPTQFSATIDVIGPAERTSLNTYIMGYASALLNLESAGKKIPKMTVQMPSREFLREGILLEGAEWGTRTGEMVWTHTLVFETSREPIDWDLKFPTSTVQQDLAAVRDDTTKFFYPTGEQLSGTQSAVIAAVASTSNSHPFGDQPGAF